MIVTVECSATKCNFKSNSGYYGICNNPKLQKEYSMFAGGRVKVSGCDCKDCDKEDCQIPETLEVT